MLGIIIGPNTFSLLFFQYFPESTNHAWIFKRNFVKVKGKLNAVGYQEMLRGELLPLITEIEDEKAPSQ